MPGFHLSLPNASCLIMNMLITHCCCQGLLGCHGHVQHHSILSQHGASPLAVAQGLSTAFHCSSFPLQEIVCCLQQNWHARSEFPCLTDQPQGQLVQPCAAAATAAAQLPPPPLLPANEHSIGKLLPEPVSGYLTRPTGCLSSPQTKILLLQQQFACLAIPCCGIRGSASKHAKYHSNICWVARCLYRWFWCLAGLTPIVMMMMPYWPLHCLLILFGLSTLLRSGFTVLLKVRQLMYAGGALLIDDAEPSTC